MTKLKKSDFTSKTYTSKDFANEDIEVLWAEALAAFGHDPVEWRKTHDIADTVRQKSVIKDTLDGKESPLYGWRLSFVTSFFQKADAIYVTNLRRMSKNCSFSTPERSNAPAAPQPRELTDDEVRYCVFEARRNLQLPSRDTIGVETMDLARNVLKGGSSCSATWDNAILQAAARASLILRTPTVPAPPRELTDDEVKECVIAVRKKLGIDNGDDVNNGTMAAARSVIAGTRTIGPGEHWCQSILDAANLIRTRTSGEQLRPMSAPTLTAKSRMHGEVAELKVDYEKAVTKRNTTPAKLSAWHFPLGLEQQFHDLFRFVLGQPNLEQWVGTRNVKELKRIVDKVVYESPSFRHRKITYYGGVAATLLYSILNSVPAASTSRWLSMVDQRTYNRLHHELLVALDAGFYDEKLLAEKEAAKDCKHAHTTVDMTTSTERCIHCKAHRLLSTDVWALPQS